MSKLSKVQIEVLGHMAQGHKIYCAVGDAPWLDGVPNDTRGGLHRNWLCKRVHSNTVSALRRKNCIEETDTSTTPLWRRDYVITDTGRELLQQARERGARSKVLS